MPFVAQVTTAVLAEAPSVIGNPWDWVRSGISIVYDNVIIGGESEDVSRRWLRLLARCVEANVKIGETQPPGQKVRSCGLEFDVSDPDDRRWRLSPTWSEKAAAWVETQYQRHRQHDREVRGGLTQWALSASLLPLAIASSTLHGVPADEEIAFLLTFLKAQRWRRLRGRPTEFVPEDAAVVITDGSITGTGFVHDGKAYAIPWRERRSMEQQQESEWTAAFLGIDHAARRLGPGWPLLLVTDNAGVIAGLISGHPQSSKGIEVVCKLHNEALRGPLWLAHVPSTDNPADQPSRLATASVTPTAAWPHPLEPQWRSAAVLARWSMAAPIPP